jgi:hypothetical protein
MPTWLKRILLGAAPAPVKIDLTALGVAECKECHKYLRHRFVLKLMTHLEREHGFSDLQAQDASVYMLELLLQHKREKTNGDTKPQGSSRNITNVRVGLGSAQPLKAAADSND